jgi:sugar phosphate isomerase/epimerase
MKYRIGGHTNSYHTHTEDEALQGISRAGFKYVELSAVEGWTEHVPLDAGDAYIESLKARLAQLGLTVQVLSGHSDLTTAHGVEVGRKAVDHCVRLGISLMNTAIGGHYSENEDRAAFMRNIHELADYAAERQVSIALEVHGDIMATGALSVPLMKEIDRPNVGICYDTANCLFYGGVHAVDDLREAAPYLLNVHLKDKIGGERVWNFPGVGEGEVDFAGIFAILDEIGYDGPLSVEIEFQGDPFPAVEEVDRSMAVSYQTLKALDVL